MKMVQPRIYTRSFGMGTAVRNPIRYANFTFILGEFFEGKKWSYKTQKDYQIKLIQYKIYHPDKLPDDLEKFWKDADTGEKIDPTPEDLPLLSGLDKTTLKKWPMKLQDAKKIWENRKDAGILSYQDKDKGMRGRGSAENLQKLGFWYPDENGKIIITKLGKKLQNNEISGEEAIGMSMLKWQIPLSKKSPEYKKGYSIKPLITTIELIKNVNDICKKKGMKIKGISRTEFEIFAGTLQKSLDAKTHAKLLIEFRKKYEKLRRNQADKKRDLEIKQIVLVNSQFNRTQKAFFLEKYTKWVKDRKDRPDGETISQWEKKNPNFLDKNRKLLHEYGDNNRRNFKLSGWILESEGKHLKFNPWKIIQTNSLLEFDYSKAIEFENETEYGKYMDNEKEPIWPWNTKEKLSEVYNEHQKWITQNHKKLNLSKEVPFLTKTELRKLDENKIKNNIDHLESYITKINTAKQYEELESSENIQNVINSLEEDYLKKEAKVESFVEYEYQCARGLFALDDGKIEPNYPKGIDGVATGVSVGVPDIECFYDGFDMICEVTTSRGANQWRMENMAVSDHIHKFIKKSKQKKVYCLFIAHSLNIRTIQYFYMNNTFSEKQEGRTIPITTKQFQQILECLKKLKEQKNPRGITHKDMQKLYDNIILSIESLEHGAYEIWQQGIQQIIDEWIQEIIA